MDGWMDMNSEQYGFKFPKETRRLTFGLETHDSRKGSEEPRIDPTIPHPWHHRWPRFQGPFIWPTCRGKGAARWWQEIRWNGQHWRRWLAGTFLQRAWARLGCRPWLLRRCRAADVRPWGRLPPPIPPRLATTTGRWKMARETGAAEEQQYLRCVKSAELLHSHVLYF